MDKARATAKLEEQIALIDNVKRLRRFSPEYKKWHRDTEVAIENIFGQDTRHVKDFTSVRYSLGVWSSSTPDSTFERVFHEGLEEARAILHSLIAEIEEYWEDESAASTPDSLHILQKMCERFHLAVRQLRERWDGRQTLEVEDEYDVQDLFHVFLHLFFDDIRREEWTPSYAGGASRMDFLLRTEHIVIEVKKTRQGLAARQVGEQLLIDIQRYQAHPSCDTLVCFVYDPEGRVANPRGLEADLSGQRGGILVKTIIVPRGV